MRYVMTRVLPVPAPARINTGPRTVSTACLCCGFRSEDVSRVDAALDQVGDAIRNDARLARACPREDQHRAADGLDSLPLLWVPIGGCFPGRCRARSGRRCDT